MIGHVLFVPYVSISSLGMWLVFLENHHIFTCIYGNPFKASVLFLIMMSVLLKTLFDIFRLYSTVRSSTIRRRYTHIALSWSSELVLICQFGGLASMIKLCIVVFIWRLLYILASGGFQILPQTNAAFPAHGWFNMWCQRIWVEKYWINHELI